MRGPDQQRHHLLLGQADWAMATHASAPLADVWALEPVDRPPTAPDWDVARRALALAPRLEAFALSPGDRPLDPATRRAAAADSAGNIYWIGDDPAQLWVQSAGDGRAAHFWPDARALPVREGLFAPLAPPAPPAPFTALAATADAWLLAATATTLLAFDLIGGGPPTRVAIPAGLRISVLAAATDAGLWLLDAAAQTLWRLDANFTAAHGPADATPPLFTPDGGAAPEASHSAATGFALATIDPAIAARAMAALPDGRLVLLSGNALLLVEGSRLIDRTPLPAGVQAIAAGTFRRREGMSDIRVVASLRSGNQAIAFAVTDTALVATAELLPLRAHGGRALVSAPSGLHFDSGPVPIWAPIVEQPRRAFAPTATFDTPIFDATTPGTVWDKLFIDGCLPPGASLIVEARAGDDPATLGDWRPQPTPLLSPSGSELVVHGPAASIPTDAATGRGSLTLLCQHLVGRHAQLRLTLASDGQASPHLFALRLHFPRVSWNARFLPALYREDADAGDFLTRWLANMNGITDQIDTRITHAQRWFGAHSAPHDALPWLAGWFDVALDPAWDEARRRAFIAHAMRFFAWRGTMRGLTSALALGFNHSLANTLFSRDDFPCEPAIRIVEHYRTRTPALADRLAAAAAAVTAETAAWSRFRSARGLPAAPLPAGAAPAHWADFLQQPAPARALWQRFLAARWRRISALNSAHASAWADFPQISLPAAPATPQAGQDWQDYAATLLPIHTSAHRFSVLLPVRPGEPTDSATLDTARRLAQRLIALEKPAHTLFDVRFYFAMNRIGEARLGLDTTLGQGSRAPELLPPAILGRAYAGESFVGSDGPATADRKRLSC